MEDHLVQNYSKIHLGKIFRYSPSDLICHEATVLQSKLPKRFMFAAYVWRTKKTMFPSIYSKILLILLLRVHFLVESFGVRVSPKVTLPTSTSFMINSSLSGTRRTGQCKSPGRGDQFRWRPESSRLMEASNEIVDTSISDEQTPSPNVDFEKQELRLIFESMDRNNVFYKMLSEAQIVSTTSIYNLNHVLFSQRRAASIGLTIPLNCRSRDSGYLHVLERAPAIVEA